MREMMPETREEIVCERSWQVKEVVRGMWPG